MSEEWKKVYELKSSINPEIYDDLLDRSSQEEIEKNSQTIKLLDLQKFFMKCYVYWKKTVKLYVYYLK